MSSETQPASVLRDASSNVKKNTQESTYQRFLGIFFVENIGNRPGKAKARTTNAGLAYDQTRVRAERDPENTFYHVAATNPALPEHSSKFHVKRTK